jgi:hypothetical protein
VADSVKGPVDVGRTVNKKELRAIGHKRCRRMVA